MVSPSENGHVLRLVWKASPCVEVCSIVAPPAFDPKCGQREVAGDFSEPDSEGTVSTGWSLSRSLRGCFEIAEEFHVRLDKGMEESGDSLCGYLAGVARACSISLPWCATHPTSREEGT